MSEDGRKRVPPGRDDAPTLYSSDGAGGSGAPPRLRSESVLFGVYRIERRLGRGGMGEVYRAEHIAMGEPRAIKMMLPELSERPDLMDRFFREARTLLDVHHPAVVKCHDLLKDDEGHFFLVMEYIDGPSLRERLEGGALSAEETRAMGARLAAGLAAAHQRLVHRDISPDNVMLPGGVAARAKLIDFGIAKEVAGARTTANFVGKFSWASPEQLGMVGGEVDFRSDYYSLGLVLCTAALGRRLELGEDPVSAIAARERLASEGPPEGIPEGLRAAIAPLLRLDPNDRPSSIATLFGEPAQQTKPEPARAPAGAGPPPLVIPAPPRHPDDTLTDWNDLPPLDIATIGHDAPAHTAARGRRGPLVFGAIGAVALLAAAIALLGPGGADQKAPPNAQIASDESPRPTGEVSSAPAFERARMALLDAGGTLPAGATQLGFRPRPLRSGDTFEIEITSGCDCRPLLFSVNGPGDRIDLLYPNAMDPARALGSRQRMVVPTSNRYELTASASAAGQPDDELVLLLLTEEPTALSIPEVDAFGLGGGELRWSASARSEDDSRSRELLDFLAAIDDSPWIAARARLEIER